MFQDPSADRAPVDGFAHAMDLPETEQSNYINMAPDFHFNTKALCIIRRQ